jgi:hypothetical protein
VIVDKGGEKSHKDKKLSCKGGEVSHKGIVRGRESKRYDIRKGSIKIEHTSRGQAHESFVAFVCALT